MEKTKHIAQQLHLGYKQVSNVLKLINEGATVAFISRYRKEQTDNLDEVAVREIELQNKKVDELLNRRKTILETIAEQGKLNDELKHKIENTWLLSELEDIYLPYKPKRRTRATIAKELGLEPLAKIAWRQDEKNAEELVYKFLKDEIKTPEDAWQGVRDIMAEWISEDLSLRQKLRNLFERKALIYSKLVRNKESQGAKFADYFDFEELLKKSAAHRILAMRRGEEEGILRITILPPEEDALHLLEKQFVRGSLFLSEQVRMAAKDSYKRLLQPSLENEFKKTYKEKADATSIDVFSQNLRQLLLAAPLGEQAVIAIDPGFRTGCKIACLDKQGQLLHNETIFPHHSQNQRMEAEKRLVYLTQKHKTEAIAIGNGTAGRETEDFVRKISFEQEIQVFVVSENGASVYSASEVAREEFPDYDVTVRGAVSIGRRLIDPLAELVKIDPKSIGVGQYQHDVDQNKLKEQLDFVVQSCVNSVGVNINTASKHLLRYVSGLGEKLAQNIIDYRAEIGSFKNRNELKKVPRMGAKTFEQCAGFLRIQGAKNPLDNSAVHPESYVLVSQMAKDINCTINDLMTKVEKRELINLQNYVNERVGLLTLQDIKSELEKPGRDPRGKIEVFAFAEGINSIEDLYEGMILPGIVTNITNFGAFVDVGVHQDGLVHISELSEHFVANPADVVRLQQSVRVRVQSVDIQRKRISLSMK